MISGRLFLFLANAASDQVRTQLKTAVLGYNGAFGAIAIRNDDAPGTLVAIHGLEQLESHPCVTKTLIGFQPGDHIPVTKELRHIPVGAWLKGSDEAAVLKAMTEIRNVVSLEIIPKQKRPI